MLMTQSVAVQKSDDFNLKKSNRPHLLNHKDEFDYQQQETYERETLMNYLKDIAKEKEMTMRGVVANTSFGIESTEPRHHD